MTTLGAGCKVTLPALQRFMGGRTQIVDRIHELCKLLERYPTDICLTTLIKMS